MNIADRALAAHQADEEARRLQHEAAVVRRRAMAVDAIARLMEQFGIPFDESELVVQWPHDEGKRYSFTTQVDDDVSLTASWSMMYSHEPEVTLSTRVCDQLYWDLPPGETVKGPGGGVYGNYGLGENVNKKIGTLVELGAIITRVRKAREDWHAKHLGGD